MKLDYELISKTFKLIYFIFGYSKNSNFFPILFDLDENDIHQEYNKILNRELHLSIKELVINKYIHYKNKNFDGYLRIIGYDFDTSKLIVNAPNNTGIFQITWANLKIFDSIPSKKG